MAELKHYNSERQLELLEQAYSEGNRHQILKFTSFVRDNDLKLNPATLLAYVDYLDQEYAEGRCAASSHATYISALCTALTTIADQMNLTDAGRLAFEHVKKTANKRKKKVQTKAVDPDEIPSLEELRLLVSSTKDRTIALIVEFLIHSGARISETLAIRLSDITVKRSYAEVTLRGKKSKERKIKVDKDLIARIREHFAGSTWLFEHHRRQYSRVSVTQRIKIEALKYIGRDISAHTIRHSVLSHLMRQTGRVKAVQELAGHSSAATTLDRYVHDSFTWEEQQKLLG